MTLLSYLLEASRRFHLKVNPAGGSFSNRIIYYRNFFLCLFLRNLFFRLCVAILCRLRFLPLGKLLTS